MDSHGGPRTKAEQDAMTVEIGYALCSAAFVAAVVYGAVAGPALLFDLPHTASELLLVAGMTLAPVVFLARVVLVRFRQAPPQPSQPGRTSPDS
ncbi:DUF6332 family protein [Streptomyces sp. NPDC005202]|uniref:DUF6332 family protein n=1 Tax=Streptomyces sp. NPDC005202 TaxID=3157021 RepID=UPI0033BB6B82